MRKTQDKNVTLLERVLRCVPLEIMRGSSECGCGSHLFDCGCLMMMAKKKKTCVVPAAVLSSSAVVVSRCEQVHLACVLVIHCVINTE